MNDAFIQTIETPDGPFTLLADVEGRVHASGWTADPADVLMRLRVAARPARVRPQRLSAADAVEAYYSGEVDAIEAVEVVQEGTPMQRAGWAALRRIPPGSPLTYAGFAEALGAPSAVRAAASICARNAPALFVPCHRVVRTGGGMGGFAWGIDVKRSLLARETVDR